MNSIVLRFCFLIFQGKVVLYIYTFSNSFPKHEIPKICVDTTMITWNYYSMKLFSKIAEIPSA